VGHPQVDKLAFTGSVEVGKLIMRGAADTLKKVSLELGGKSPNIFFADADFEAAVDGALFGVFINQGEVCSAGSRVLVERPIYRKMLDAMVEKAKRIKLGPGLDRETKMGPVVSRDQLQRVTRYQEIGKKEAKVAFGGGRPGDPALQKGYFVEPTIFYDVDNAATIAREEIFGPVMAVIPFEGEAEALKIANDTRYGLAAAVWSRDIFKCFRMVKRLQAGIVWVNHMQPTYVEAPWGGYKMSGIGRELGPWGAEEYLQVKQVYINLNEQPIGWYGGDPLALPQGAPLRDARAIHLHVPAHGEEGASGHGQGRPDAADVGGGGRARIEDERHRKRAGPVGRGGVPAGEAGAHQPERATHRVVLRRSVGAPAGSASLPPERDSLSRGRKLDEVRSRGRGVQAGRGGRRCGRPRLD